MEMVQAAFFAFKSNLHFGMGRQTLGCGGFCVGMAAQRHANR